MKDLLPSKVFKLNYGGGQINKVECTMIKLISTNLQSNCEKWVCEGAELKDTWYIYERSTIEM